MRADPDSPLRIEVSISEELLRLVGLAHSPVNHGQDGRDCAAARAIYERGGWKDIVLRHDGQRPLCIRAMMVFACACPAKSALGSFEQRMVLYVADDCSLYASLAFVPDEIVGACPAYLSRHIEDADAFAALIRDWWPEGCFHPCASAGVSKNRDNAESARLVRSSFNAMMTECLRTGFLHA